MGNALDNLLASKPTTGEAPTETAGFKKLPPEQFAELTTQVEEFRKRILKGETLSVQEAALITVWFRNRRVEGFILAASKAKPKKKTSTVGVKRKRTLKSEEKQALGAALLDSL